MSYESRPFLNHQLIVNRHQIFFSPVSMEKTIQLDSKEDKGELEKVRKMGNPTRVNKKKKKQERGDIVRDRVDRMDAPTLDVFQDSKSPKEMGLGVGAVGAGPS